MRDEWTEARIDELGNGLRPVLKAGPFGSSVTKATYQASGYKVYGQQEVVAKDLNAEAYFVSETTFSRHKSCAVRPGDLLMTMMGTIGRVYRVPEGAPEGIINPRLVRLAFDTSRILPEYAEVALEQPPLQRLLDRRSHGGTMQGLNLEAIASIRLPLPPLAEQRKIAKILRTWDTAIQKTEQLIAAKERHFAATSHLLLTSRKRLNGFTTRWGFRRADEIFENTSRKGHLNEPLLSVTQERGVIPRDMLEGRVTMPSGETGAFKLVEPGNFVISLRSFQGGLEHSNYRGLVSPAYTVLREVVEIDERFFRHYFKSADFIKRLSVAVIGIRDGKQISFQDFCSIKLPFPAVDEQKAIAAFLDEAEGEIGLLRKYTDALKTQKRGLMQKLLTGQWRLRINENTEETTCA